MDVYGATVERQRHRVRWLPSKDFNVNTQGDMYGTALQAAASRGQTDIVQLLLNTGADINAQGGQYGTALRAAAYMGQKDRVQLLLDAGVDINAQGGQYGTALQAAAYRGQKNIVQLLLDKNADVNVQGGWYGTALQAAASRGQTDIVQLLLDTGAEINVQGGFYGTALQAAASEGQIDRVQLLLDEGAEINAQGGQYGTALQAAASEGQKNIAQLLLDKGADVNVQGGWYGTALQAAASRGQTDIVQLLLDEGADLNAQGGQYGTALQAAAYGGETRMVQLLLDEGADVNVQGGFYGTAIHAAVCMKRKYALRLLLAEGPHLHARDAVGRTALHVAVEAGSLLSISELLTRDAPTNIGDFRGTTPLQLAAQKGNYEAARLLFPKSTDSLSSIEASVWRSLLPGHQSHLEITNGEHRLIRKRPEDNIRSRAYPLFENRINLPAKADDIIRSSRIFILADGALLSRLPTGVRCRFWHKVQKPDEGPTGPFHEDRVSQIWQVESIKAPSLTTLTHIPEKDCFVECSFTTRAITLPTPKDSSGSRFSDNPKHDDIQLVKTFGVLWIMIKPDDKRDDATVAVNTLKSTMFFSTSEYAQVPPCAKKLFVPLVQQISQEWNRTFEAAESRLASQRTGLLKANGKNKSLIRDLLEDAQRWDLLSKDWKKQIAELQRFYDTYSSNPWRVLRENSTENNVHQDEDMKCYLDEVQKLGKECMDGLEVPTKTSQDLIQLEFNLVSIAEAQRSTSTNTSMKRLSWITFVFLPPMFIASLFGMNIDILDSNPAWWLYIPFAVVTMIITLGIWIVFKLRPSLEDSMEDGFNRLIGRQPEQDLERGQSVHVSPDRRTAMFSAFGKKRS